MDALLAVEKEETKLLSKYTKYEENIEKHLDELIGYVQSVKEGLCQGCDDSSMLGPLQSHVLAACAKRVTDVTNKVAGDHKELHTSVSKIGKAIDRNFTSDFNGTTQEDIFAGDSKALLNEAISEHLLRNGLVDVADTLTQECGLSVGSDKKAPFTELNRILDEFKARNLQPALSWVREHRTELTTRQSSLEFKLKRLRFLNLLSSGQHKEALTYAIQQFKHFPAHAKEIQRLMCTFAYLKRGLENSPYSDLLDPRDWDEVADHLSRDACSLLGLAVNSPLEVCVTAGCVALPTLLQIRQVMQQRQVEGAWSAKEELPVEIDLGREFQFHSVFACPILRQQCGRTNPPMRLVCGHVISKDALKRLSHANKMKCPYCPLEMDPRDATRIYF